MSGMVDVTIGGRPFAGGCFGEISMESGAAAARRQHHRLASDDGRPTFKGPPPGVADAESR